MNAPHLPPRPAATTVQPPLVPHSPDDPYVDRTERGLVVRGTRITLYALWEDVVAGDDTEAVRQFYRLTPEQVAGVLAFIKSNQAAFDAEYQFVLQSAEEVRRYHEERNRERFAEIAAIPPPPGKERQYAELQERKRQLGML